MALQAGNTALSSLNTAHRVHFAQVNDVVVAVNGHDANQVYWTRTATAATLGMAQPGAAPGASASGAGNVTGAVQYRVRWVDELRGGTMSLPSASVSVTVTDNTVAVTQPASPPSRATHWIVERTTNGGSVFFPVNRDSAAPYGTAISTTSYNDTVADGTLRNRIAIDSRQGMPNPYRFAFSNAGRIFLGGGRVHRASASLTNSNTAVSSGSGFNSYMIGQDLAATTDTDGKTYKISAVGGATALTLASAYTGTTATKTVTIAGRRDIGAWSEPNRPEEFGSATAVGWSNEVQIGDDGQPLLGGCGLGAAGVVWAKETRSYMHSYTFNPDGVLGDGRLVELPGRRGTVGPLAIKFHEGRAYGIDQFGIWRMAPGGRQEEIGRDIAHDWRSCQLDYTYADNWHIAWSPQDRALLFFVTFFGAAYPKTAYVWSLEREKWIGTRQYDQQITSTVVLPDSKGVLRMVLFSAPQTDSGNTVKSFAWMDGISYTRGAPPASTSPLTGTVTSSTAGNISVSGASFPTTNGGLEGCAVTVRNTAGSEETRMIYNNNGTSFDVLPAMTITPATYRLAPIPAVYRSGRISLDLSRKQQVVEVWVWARYQGAVTPIKCRWFMNGAFDADNDKAFGMAEDGVSFSANGNSATIDPSIPTHKFRIPVGTYCKDIQLEFYSIDAHESWNILQAAIVLNPDMSFDQRRR
jgi:hypothetical protein